jgi:hypothetical protein
MKIVSKDGPCLAMTRVKHYNLQTVAFGVKNFMAKLKLSPAYYSLLTAINQ